MEKYPQKVNGQLRVLLLWKSRQIYFFIFLSQVICITAGCFHLIKVLLQEIDGLNKQNS